MNKSEVISLLKENKNQRGINNWNEMKSGQNQIDSFGIGLTVLRKLAKKIGKDHDLAVELWESSTYDVKVISILIDDPKLVTEGQMEAQVEGLNFGLLVHVFSACGSPFAKTPFILGLIEKWLKHTDTVRRRCAYGFLYEVSKSYKKSAPDSVYFLNLINHIAKTFTDEDNLVRMSMAGALMGIGKRNVQLNKAALKVSRKIGPVSVESGKTKCEPFDVSKHLTSDYLVKKLYSS